MIILITYFHLIFDTISFLMLYSLCITSAVHHLMSTVYISYFERISIYKGKSWGWYVNWSIALSICSLGCLFFVCWSRWYKKLAKNGMMRQFSALDAISDGSDSISCVYVLHVCVFALLINGRVNLRLTRR